EQLQPLVEAAQRETFAPGTRIAREGEQGDRAYFITEGHVQVLGRVEREGTIAETVITWLGPGDVAGEISLLDEGSPSASYIAVTTTTCLSLAGDQFLGALQQHWPLTREFLRVMAQRLRAAYDLVAEHARDPLTGLSQRQAA